MHAPRTFTGRHMTIILVAFFSVVIAVNLIMARAAIGTFGGTVVDNSYVASQNYNDWLAQGRAQRALGWDAAFSRDAGGYLMVTLTASGSAMADASAVTATARPPLGRAEVQTLRFVALGEGRYRSVQPIGAGRQDIKLTVVRGSDSALFDSEVR
jgi:nitrogen fixation protein FixH